jgi:hypothetical protein
VLAVIVVACGGGYGGMSGNYAPPVAATGPASVSVGAIMVSAAFP